MRTEELDGDWRSLWQDYGPRLLLFARQQTPRLADAEDLVQEAFVRYWRARQREASLAPGLLFTMVRRIAIDFARKAEARSLRDSPVEAPPSEPEVWFTNPVEEQERKNQIEEALRCLPAAQREVLVLKIWGGLTFEQIGETLEVSPHTVASRYRYGLGHLRQILTPAVL